MNHIHTCVISYNRLELTQRAIASYLETVTVPWSLIVVDNNSTDGAQEWLRHWIRTEAPINRTRIHLLGENKYPGYACNRGWELMPDETTLLHRSDNDFVFLPGWCEEVLARFAANQDLGQLGLRTDEEELHNRHNVGGNNVIRRNLWDTGLRYDERSWEQISRKVPGFTEDSFMSPAVVELGWEWGRVERPCIVAISSEDPNDDYYQETWRVRGIAPPTT